MDRFERDAILLSLIENIEKSNGWCGENHVQKACYLLEELFGSQLGFKFILYKHAPYSFDLSEELIFMRVNDIIELQVKNSFYLPCLTPSRNSQMIEKEYSKIIEDFMPRVLFVTEKIKGKEIPTLENINTALYVTRKMKTDESIEARSKRIHELKPYFTIGEAHEALKTIDRIVDEVQNSFFPITKKLNKS